MTRVGILSDTHTYVLEQIKEFFADCDELWHAGDIGNEECLHAWQSFKPLRAVYGNIDDYKVRLQTSEFNFFEKEGFKILITHIGGYPGKYYKEIENKLYLYKPNIFVCGHSHILKVMKDQKHNLMYFNPGAAGKHGFHTHITALRLILDSGNMKKLEVFDLDRFAK